MGKYMIVVGTTDSKNRAQQQYNLVNRDVINLGIKTFNTESGELYRVEAGPYSKRKQMLQDLDKIKGLGMINAFITNDG